MTYKIKHDPEHDTYYVPLDNCRMCFGSQELAENFIKTLVDPTPPEENTFGPPWPDLKIKTYLEFVDLMMPIMDFVSSKHAGYGGCFDKIYKTYGTLSMGPRLADKYYRFEHLMLQPHDPHNPDPKWVEDMLEVMSDMIGYEMHFLRHLRGLVKDDRSLPQRPSAEDAGGSAVQG